MFVLHLVFLEGVTGAEQLEVTRGWESEARGVESGDRGEDGHEDTERGDLNIR